MLVGSLTATESQAAFLRGTSPEAGGRTGAGTSSAHDSGSLLAGALRRAGAKPAGGRAVKATTKTGECLQRKPCRHVGRDKGAVMPSEFSGSAGQGGLAAETLPNRSQGQRDRGAVMVAGVFLSWGRWIPR